jgi:hypothetical protein
MADSRPSNPIPHIATNTSAQDSGTGTSNSYSRDGFANQSPDIAAIHPPSHCPANYPTYYCSACYSRSCYSDSSCHSNWYSYLCYRATSVYSTAFRCSYWNTYSFNN